MALSRFSVIFGVPVSTWGILFYLVFITLALWGFLRRDPPWPWGFLGLLSGAAVGFSTFQFMITEMVRLMDR